MGKFQKYVPGRIDREAQEKKKFLIEHKEEISKKMQSNDLERSKRSEKEEDRDAR